VAGGAAGLRLAATLALAACGAPKEADQPLSEYARNAPPPLLAPTEIFDAPLAEGAAAAGRLDESRADLEARAAALRARGEALAAQSPIAPEDRARLEAGTAAPSDP